MADRSTHRRDDVPYVSSVGVSTLVCLFRSLLSSLLPWNIRRFHRSDQPIPDRSDWEHVTTITDQMLPVNGDGCKGGREAEDDVNA